MEFCEKSIERTLLQGKMKLQTMNGIPQTAQGSSSSSSSSSSSLLRCPQDMIFHILKFLEGSPSFTRFCLSLSLVNKALGRIVEAYMVQKINEKTRNSLLTIDDDVQKHCPLAFPSISSSTRKLFANLMQPKIMLIG